MSEKLQPLTLIRALLNPESIKEGTPEYIADQEFQKSIAETASVLLSRYTQKRNIHWNKNEKKNALMGMAGQTAFQKVLEYLKIPYEMDNPIATTRKPYDFKISLGTIEVKTVNHYSRKVIIKISEWHGNDYLIVWQVTENGIRLIGWLTQQEVEAYPIRKKRTTKYNPYSTSYIIDLSDLSNSKTFITKLKETKAKMFDT